MRLPWCVTHPARRRRGTVDGHETNAHIRSRSPRWNRFSARAGLSRLDDDCRRVDDRIGHFVVPADIARNVGSGGWLILAWVCTGLLTIAAALAYGELAAMMPHAGGQYVSLRESYSPLWGFLYGWTLFLVIQSGTIAAVAVAFTRYLGVLVPSVSPVSWIISPIQLSEK